MPPVLSEEPKATSRSPVVLDTSIWLDWFEDRNEPHFPKSDMAHRLLSEVVIADDQIVVSDVVIFELSNVGYSLQEVDRLLRPLKSIIVFVEATEKEVRKSKDLSRKRLVPQGDALHALIARNHKAVIVTFDRDFQKLVDIVKSKTPRELV